jgi:hypothetical protein
MDKWVIEPVTPLGMGNPTIAQAAAQQLMAQRGAYSPLGQQEILHESTLVITGDPRKAARWAPLGKQQGITNGIRDAQQIFGTLYAGIDLPPKEEYSPIEQVETLLPMLGQKINEIQQTAQMATMEQTVGLGTIAQYIQKLIRLLVSDPQQKQRVKIYSDALGKMMNGVKALAQRGAEAHRKQAEQGNGNGDGKVQSMLIAAASKAKIAEARTRQRMAHDQQRFRADEARKDAETAAQIERDNTTAANTRLRGFEE